MVAASLYSSQMTAASTCNITMRTRLLFAAGILTCACAANADSSAVGLTGPVNAGNGADYTQGSYALGFEFTVNTPISVTQLGAYDSNLATGGTQETFVASDVGLYDLTTSTLLASAVVTDASTSLGDF